MKFYFRICKLDWSPGYRPYKMYYMENGGMRLTEEYATLYKTIEEAFSVMAKRQFYSNDYQVYFVERVA